MNHVIAKTVFNVTADTSFDGFALQQDLSNLFWHKMSEAIDKVFENLDLKDKTLIINTLELDLGEIGIRNWQQALTDKLIEALHIALKNRVAEAWTTTPQEGQSADAATTILQRERLFEVWLYFLKTGALPPSVSAALDEAIWHKAIAETLTLSESAERQFIELIRLSFSPVPMDNQARGTALERLVLQFEEKFLAQLAAILIRSPLEKLPEFRLSFLKFLEKQATQVSERLPIASQDRVFKKDIRKLYSNYAKPMFWITLFQRIGTDNILKASPESLALIPFKAFFENNVELKSRAEWITFFQNSLTSNTNTSTLHASEKNKSIIAKPDNFGVTEWEDVCKTILEKMKKNTEFSMPGSRVSDDFKLGSSHEATGNPDQASENADLKNAMNKPKSKTRNLKLETQQPKQDSRSPNPSEEVQYIQNAGVVLTHAFLPMFFKELKLINDKKQFRNQQAQHRAIHLIHYLASGQEGLPEYRLLLPKLLGGLRLDLPIERGVVLKKKEKKEADALLKAVIKHWGALGNASIEALREGFFNRDGKLSTTDKGQLLQIEQRTEDILLSRLPWSISMIKLPWMPEMLFVEWT